MAKNEELTETKKVLVSARIELATLSRRDNHYTTKPYTRLQLYFFSVVDNDCISVTLYFNFES